jgi:hypothetical protein
MPTTGQVLPSGFDPLLPDESWDDRFVEPGVNHEVWTIAVDDSGTIFIAGEFTTAGGRPANYIAQWDGTEWSPLGLGMDDTVRALEVTGVVGSGGTLYAGGDFTTAGGGPARHIASWDGTSWSEVGSGTNASVRALELDESNVLYVGGQFNEAGGVAVNRLARWDGAAWSNVGGGVNGRVQALASFGTVDDSGGLYVGGDFDNAGVPDTEFENNIALWTGTTWAGLPRDADRSLGIPGRGAQVSDIVISSDGNLYIAASRSVSEYDGSITQILDRGAVSVSVDENDVLFAGFDRGVSVWDGTAWTLLDGEIGLVRSLALDADGNLLAGGNINSAELFPAQFISRWNGSEWLALGDGVNAPVQAIEVGPSGTLYIGGRILGGVGFWDGSRWQTVGEGLENSEVRAMDSDSQGNLYAGGTFTSVTDPTINDVAVWNGTDWSGLGSGVNGGVRDLVVDAAGKVFVTGQFLSAGSTPVNGVAMWDGTSWQALGTGIDGCCGGGGFGTALAVQGDVGNGGVLYLGGPINSVDGVSVGGVAQWDGVSWSPLGDELGGFFLQELSVDDNGILYAGGRFSVTDGQGIARWNGTAWINVGEVRLTNVREIAFGETGTVFAGGRFASGSSISYDYIAQWDGETWDGLDGGTNDFVEALATSGDNVFAGGFFTEAGGNPSWYIGRWKSAPMTETETLLVTGDGLLSFPTVQVDIDLQRISGSGLITVTRVNNPPANPDGITEENISIYRWVIRTPGDLTISAESQIRFDDPTQQQSAKAATDIVVYYRSVVGTGPFTPLATSFDASNGQIVATGLNGFGEFVFASDVEPLPVEISSFSGQHVGESVRLEWSTISETNNDRFEIERLEEGGGTEGTSAAWSVVGTVAGAGTTSEPQSYRFTDTELPYVADRLTYRLRQVDTDGTASLTKEVTVQRNLRTVELLSPFPNPVRQTAIVRYATPRPMEVSLRLYDVLGRVVRTLADGRSDGRVETPTDLSDLSSGVYFLRLEAGNTVMTRRLSIVR